MPKTNEHPAPDRPYWANNQTAKKLYQAYVRILEGEPIRIDKRTRLTLSAVAAEAGYQRSTLSRRRFPELCEMIEKSARRKPGQTMHAMFKAKERAARNLRAELDLERKRNGVITNQLANLALQVYKKELMAEEDRHDHSATVVNIRNEEQ